MPIEPDWGRKVSAAVILDRHETHRCAGHHLRGFANPRGISRSRRIQFVHIQDTHSCLIVAIHAFSRALISRRRLHGRPLYWFLTSRIRVSQRGGCEACPMLHRRGALTFTQISWFKCVVSAIWAFVLFDDEVLELFPTSLTM